MRRAHNNTYRKLYNPVYSSWRRGPDQQPHQATIGNVEETCDAAVGGGGNDRVGEGVVGGVGKAVYLYLTYQYNQVLLVYL